STASTFASWTSTPIAPPSSISAAVVFAPPSWVMADPPWLPAIMSGRRGQLKGHDLDRRLHGSHRHGPLQQSASAHHRADEYRDGNVPAGAGCLTTMPTAPR